MDIEHRIHRVGPWVVLAVFWAVAYATLGDYGLTTDEPWRMLWSRGWDDALSSGQIRAYTEMPEREFYGVAYDLLGRFLWLAHRDWFGGADEFLARHALNVFTAGLGLVGTYRLARTLDGPRTALVAMVLLATAPRYYGSAFINPKDIPFSAAAVWAAWACLELVAQPSKRRWVLVGVLAGVCAAVRPFGVVFYFLAAASVLIGSSPNLGVGKRVASAIGVMVVAYLVTLALWPVLWVRPPWHLITASLELTRHVHGSRSLFLGELHPFWDAPSSYVVVWLGVTLPVSVVVGVLLGLGFLISRVVRRQWPTRAELGWVLLVGWVVGPAVLPAVRQTTLYDTSRHLLFMVPPLCIFAASAFARLAQRGRNFAALVSLGVLAGIVGCVISCVRLHPYQSLHFNALVGGVRGAQGRFDVAHYSESYREGFRWVRDHDPGAAVHVVGNGSAAASYLGWKYGLGLNAEHFRYFLSEVRQGWEETLSGEVVHRIERDGTPILKIRRVDPLTHPQAVFIRPKLPDETGPPLDPSTEPERWTKISATGTRFAVDQHLDGGPGYVAIPFRTTEAGQLRLILVYYLALEAWVDGTRVFSGQVVPFHYRGTEDFPSLLPLPVPATGEVQWFLADVSEIRQFWKFGVFAPRDQVRWGTEEVYAEVVRRPLEKADLILERDAEQRGRLLLQPPGRPAEVIPCDRLPGAWGLWVDDVDGDGRAEAIVALRKSARFDPIVENRLHVYSFEDGRCVPAWRGTRLSGRFEALAQDGQTGTILVDERLHPPRRRLARYRWVDFGYRLDEVLWEGEGPIPSRLRQQFEFTEQPT